MKLASIVIAAVLVVGLSASAFAQSGSGQSTAATATAASATANQVNPAQTADNPRGWMASAFIGSNFGASRENRIDLSAIENLDLNSDTSFNWGGQVGYLGRGVIGGEFLMDFSPGLSTFNNALFVEPPDVSSYMFNLIAAAPFGQASRVDPYISGGIGAVSISSTIYALNPVATQFRNNPNAIATIDQVDVSSSRFGWNLGGGFMAWSEKNWGFRGDVRYYATTSNNNDLTDFDLDNIGDGSNFSRVELAGISFWKVNAGLSFRW
jgi:hypothetical protein